MSGPDLDTLYYGDCLAWMKRWDDSSIDLIYLDPPFKSDANYNILFRNERGGDAQYRAFSDTWSWDEAAADRFAVFENAPGLPSHDAIVGLYQILGPSGMFAYLTYMAERLEEMKRLLKPNGSIFLHCDPTASHYLKVIMDAIFSAKCFRNEIVWCYTGPGSPGMRQFSRKHDTILWYSVGSEWTFNTNNIRVPYTRLNTNQKGAMIADPLTPEERDRYLAMGKVPESWWTRFSPVGRLAKERLGYPTQKPLSLLERILQASSNEGDVVLDPFCGCGTTIVAARKLRRHWIGIDISAFAVDLIRKKRLQDPNVPTKGIPYDLKSAEKLAVEDPFSFESWAVTRIPGFAPNVRQVSDGGVDGRAKLAQKPDNHDSRLALAQIKGGRFHLSALRDFIGVTHRDKAALGCFVTLSDVDSAHARAEAANVGSIIVSGQQYRRMQIWPISQYFQQKLPNLPIMTDPYSGKPLDQGLLFSEDLNSDSEDLPSGEIGAIGGSRDSGS